MNETILSKLEASRKELLDLGLRNPLLNYKQPKSRGIHVVQEKSASIFDIIVNQGKSMSFIGRPSKDGKEELEFTELSDSELEESYSDTKLQTNESEMSLQNKLLNTYYSARTSIEEQGVNILYMALGLLHWYESENSQEERLAPLLLIPVTLERSSARERFRVKYSLEEIGSNISLQAKMKADFGLTIPDLPEIDDFNIELYFDKIKNIVDKYPRWNVEYDAIELGFFSFGKFMIYNDLDNNKWPKDNKPIEHKILLSLFEDGFRDGLPTIPEDVFVDRDTNAHEIFQVVDADSSQILAMLAIQEGKNLVIQGPPGTGKSQTITNIIADAIGRGKKVLFVAEKMAALEVVKRRLDNIHIGDACLELHSHKANKKELHQELRRVLELGKPSLEKLKQEISLLENYKEELNSYCFAINSNIKSSGMTAHKVIGYLLKLYRQVSDISIPKIQLNEIETWDVEKMVKAEAFVERIQARVNDIGIPSKLLFWGSKLKVLLPGEQESLVSQLEETKKISEALKKESQDIAIQMALAIPLNLKDTIYQLSLLEIASKQPDLSEIKVKNESWLLNQEDIRELLNTGTYMYELQKKYENIFIPEAWEQNVIQIRQDLLTYGKKWYKFIISSYRKSIKQLSAICKIQLPKEITDKLQIVNDILEFKRLETILKEHSNLAGEIFGKRWQKLKSKWQELLEVKEYLTIVHQKVIDGNCPKEFLNFLNRNENPDVARKNYDKLKDSISNYEKSFEQLKEKLDFDESVWFPEKGLIHLTYERQIILLSDWIKRIAEIHQVISWNNLSETAIDEGLESLINISIDWEDANTFLKIALQKTWFEYLLEQAITKYPSLRKFERTSHEEVVQQFRKLDLLNFQYNRARVAYQHWENMPRLEAGGQVNVLRNEFNKKARHMPIRKLMQEAGLAIQAIKPVFMMSPLSIANFLTPGALEFDMVVFDEASQVKPVDALGAILRGKQIIVVGDNKQLPPTSFFDSLTSEIEDEDNITVDLQSILGMCDAKGAPQRMLRWHYRSLHESLITFSNNHFYENKLVTFPSPGSRHRMGLVFHHVKDTIYDRGKTRTNQKEAEIVADAVIEHARKNSKLSLGVAAFSNAQRQAIQDALEIRRRKNPEIEMFFKSHPTEPFFVKNLENVQGDERDVIFISIGFGRSDEGYISMSFGPLNNDGGERRLNVLITRAKLRCEVFTNLTSDDIDLNRTKSIGVRALKSFLYFAQHGKIHVTEETGLPADSPFEESVADKLLQLGYIVRKQVGSQGFYIDLAIVDPENPGRYIIGIECDGASYHSAQSARDRDRLRQQVLENIGWKIHRVWSTDWFRNPERELKRLIGAIEKAKEILLIDDEEFEEEENSATELTIHREKIEEISNNIPIYEIATLSSEIASEEIHLHTIGKLSGWIEQIVKIESPIHFDEVARRMVEAAGIARVGPRIREVLKKAVRFCKNNGQIKKNGEFLWTINMQKPTVRDRSNLPNSARRIKYIAPEEIEVALEKVVRDSIAIQPEESIPFIAKMFGYSRVTEDMKNDIMKIINKALDHKIIYQDGEYLKMKNES